MIKTKDGKHELVFPQDFIQNHGIGIRGAFEGRRLWEIYRLLNNPERLKELDAKYPKLLKSWGYDFGNDPEQFFKEISVPATAKILGIKEGKHECDDKIWVGDSFVEPYVPMSHFITDNGELYVWSHEFLNSDSMNNRGRWRVKHLIDYYERVLEIKQYPHLLDEMNLAKLEGSAGQSSSLEELANDAENIKFFRDVSRCLVLAAKVEALWALDNISRCYAGFHDYYFTETPFGEGRVYASESLKREVAESALGLCDEYLSEMKD